MAGTFVSAFVATCLTLSAFVKWFGSQRFREAIDKFSVLGNLPNMARSLLARTTPVIEVAVAALLVSPWTRVAGAIGAVALASMFVLVVGLDSRATIAHCGCWGVASADIPRSLYVARGGLLLVAALGALTASATEWNTGLELVAFGLTAPFALLLLELPQIAEIVRIQQLAWGEPS